jgi:hypothetical protein
MLVLRRLNGSGSIRAVAPRTSCLLLFAATMIKRKDASIPGQSSVTSGALTLREVFFAAII